VLAGGLRRLPADRYPSAREFGEALQGVERSMGLPVTPLELPADEWAPTAYSGDGTGAPVRSTVSIEKQRQRVLSPLPHTGTHSRSDSRRERLGRGIVIGIIIGGAAVVGIVVTAIVVLGR